MAKDGDQTPFGFKIPKSWPRWKLQCRAHRRSSPDVQCKNWAVRGMPTCRRHGSGGTRNLKIGLVRYLAWIVIGMPKDTPETYARSVAIAAALEMMFNHGYGTVEQRLKAAQWLLDAEQPARGTSKAYKEAKARGEEPDSLTGAELFVLGDDDAQTTTEASGEGAQSPSDA